MLQTGTAECSRSQHVGELLVWVAASRIRRRHCRDTDCDRREDKILRARKYADADEAEDEEASRRKQEHAADEKLHTSPEAIGEGTQDDPGECTRTHGPEAQPATTNSTAITSRQVL